MTDVPITLVSVLREPLPSLLRFITWHRHQGVGAFRLYFDDPDDPALAALADVRDVICTPCTADFWASLGLTPDDRFTRRQCAALTHGYRQVTEGWVAVCDGDELFHCEGEGLASLLGGLSPEVAAVRILPAEVIQTDIRDGMTRFRTPMQRPEVDRIYGPSGPLVRRNRGLVGHRQGKSVTRAGQEIKIMRQHWAQDGAGETLPEVVLPRESGAVLLHFFDRGYDSWRAKLSWRIGAWGLASAVEERLRPLHLALQAGEAEGEAADAALRAEYLALHHFDAAKIRALDDIGCLYALPDAEFARIDADLAGLLDG